MDTANQAISVHPDIDYSVVKRPKGRALATDLIEDALQACGFENLGMIVTKSEALENLMTQHPLIVDRHVPFILGEHVTTESGRACAYRPCSWCR